MDLDSLQARIASNTHLPVYLFHGEEEFFLEQWARRLADAALGDGDPSFNFHQYRDGDDRDERRSDRGAALAREIAETADSYPFISERRVILVWNAEKVANIEPLASYIRNPNPTTVLILVSQEEAKAPAKKPAGRKAAPGQDVLAWLKSGAAKDCAIEFRRLSQGELAGWVMAELQRRGKSIGQEEAMLLVDIKDESSRDIAGEIDKIVIALRDVATVEERHILDLCGYSKTYNVFQLSDAVLAHNLPKATEIGMHLLGSSDPIAIVAFLHRQFSLLWGIHGRPVRQNITYPEAVSMGFSSPRHYLSSTRWSKRFTSQRDFELAFEALIEADLAAKSGVDKTTCLTMLLHRLCRLAA